MKATLRTDLPASMVVFLVAIPLSLGISVASGAPVIAGLIAAAVGGIVAGALGGAPLQVSGPAAGLTVVVADLISRYGLAATCAVTMAAGAVQILLGASRVARAVLVVSPAVVHGMLAGIGVVIVLAQFHVVLGGQPQSSAVANLRDLPGQVAHNHSHDVAIGVLTIALLLVWSRLPRRARRVPGPLVAVVAATVVATWPGWDPARLSLPDDLLGTWTTPRLPDAGWGDLAVAVGTVALVASVESLLSAVAVDRMHDGPRARLNRELVGQGSANLVSGGLGGLPVTGVIVRSSTNVAAGARTRASAVLHGVWVVVFVVLFGANLERIPLAALAALLVFVGIQMINTTHVRHAHHHGEIVGYAVTLVGVVLFSPIVGVALGLAVAALLALRRLTRCTVRTEQNEGRWHVVVEGSLTFLAVPRLTAALAAVPAGAPVDLDLNVDFLDHAAFEAIHAWRLGHERLGGSVDIDELHEDWYERAATGTPGTRKTVPAASPRWWAPWSARSVHQGGEPMLAMLSGAQEFHRHMAPVLRPLLSRLAVDGQAPAQLFLTCADSRVVPNLITASGPGDLFTVRNIGNLVPRYGCRRDDSLGAAVEFAVEVLGVGTITVCGHSLCGAMKALLDGSQDADRAAAAASALGRWLTHGHSSLARYRAAPFAVGGPGSTGLERLALVNVTQQLDNLLTYPTVRRAVRDRGLRLAGLYFDIETARVHVLDPLTGDFVCVGTRTAVGTTS